MTEVDHGTIPDDLAWSLPSGAEVLEPFQVFRCSPEDGARHTRAMARSGSLGMYVRSFPDGGGENGLHSHPSDAIWLVLEGSASFHAPGGVSLGTLSRYDGILVPALTSYRFICSGPSLLARISVPAEV